MESFLQENTEKKGINKIFIVGILIGVVLIGIAIGLLSRQPSMDEQKAQILDGSYREGSPQFAEITKDIIISTDFNKTIQSPNAFGGISMYINGNIFNKGKKNIVGLEINVGVVNQKNEVLKEKRVLVVPTQQSILETGQTIPATLSLDGFKKDDDRANIRWKVTAIKIE
jgi:hypothetical protein